MKSTYVLFFHVIYCVYPRFLGFFKKHRRSMKLFDRSNAAPWCPAMLPTILLSLIINSPKWAVNPFLNRLHGTTLFLETSSMIFVRFPSNTVRMWEFGQTNPSKPNPVGVVSTHLKNAGQIASPPRNRFVRFLLGFIPCPVSIHIQLGILGAHYHETSPKVTPPK